VQIDATRLSPLTARMGACGWGRRLTMCRAACVGRSLSQERAAHTLQKGIIACGSMGSPPHW